jgi:RNase P/RNase MRP subunit POP5
MKALKPSHREHKRYLLLSGKDANSDNIKDSILRFIGVLGYAKASPQFIKNEQNKLILAINREELDKIRSSFALSGMDIQIKKVSGILNHL